MIFFSCPLLGYAISKLVTSPPSSDNILGIPIHCPHWFFPFFPFSLFIPFIFLSVFPNIDYELLEDVLSYFYFPSTYSGAYTEQSLKVIAQIIKLSNGNVYTYTLILLIPVPSQHATKSWVMETFFSSFLSFLFDLLFLL